MDGYRVSGAGPAFHRFGIRVRYSRSDLEGGEPPGHDDGGGRQGRIRLWAGIPAFAQDLAGPPSRTFVTFATHSPPAPWRWARGCR